MDALKTNDVITSDIYKCSKISIVIPGIIECIDKLEKLDEAFNLNVDLKVSKRKFESISVTKESYTEDEIEEFREKLFEALISLATGIKTTRITKFDEVKKVDLSNIMADLAAYQDDINRVASK